MASFGWPLSGGGGITCSAEAQPQVVGSALLGIIDSVLNWQLKSWQWVVQNSNFELIN